ncbi:MAG: VOC family protein [Silvanigrellales bacterium]|nr:VOC family protein [Silvanigrellales bacterium]
MSLLPAQPAQSGNVDAFRSPFLSGLSHLALVVDDVAKAHWFFETVLGCDVQIWRETQLLVHIGEDLLVAKLSKDAVDSERQRGPFGRQTLDHYGFMAKSPELVDALAERLQAHGIAIVKGPYDRSDGRAVYFRDPFGNLVEYLYYAPVRAGV